MRRQLGGCRKVSCRRCPSLRWSMKNQHPFPLLGQTKIMLEFWLARRLCVQTCTFPNPVDVALFCMPWGLQQSSLQWTIKAKLIFNVQYSFELGIGRRHVQMFKNSIDNGR